MKKQGSKLVAGIIFILISLFFAVFTTVLTKSNELATFEAHLHVKNYLNVNINVVFSILSLICLLIGLVLASKEEPLLTSGLVFTVAISFIYMFVIVLITVCAIKENKVLSAIATYGLLVIDIIKIIIFLSVIEFCQSKYGKKKKLQNYVKYGIITEALMVVSIGVSVVLSVLYRRYGAISANESVFTSFVIFSGVLLALGQIAYLVYLFIFVKNSKTLLNK